jgi:hypothetical protein
VGRYLEKGIEAADVDSTVKSMSRKRTHKPLISQMCCKAVLRGILPVVFFFIFQYSQMQLDTNIWIGVGELRMDVEVSKNFYFGLIH